MYIVQVHIIIIYTHIWKAWLDANLNRQQWCFQEAAGNNCWSHATALITESRLCIESRGQFLAAKAPGQEVAGEMGQVFFGQPPWWNLLSTLMSTSTSTFFCTFFLVLIVLKNAGAEQAVLLENFPGSMEPMHGWANRSSLLAGTDFLFSPVSGRFFHGMPRCLAQAWWPWLLHGRFRASWFQDCFKARRSLRSFQSPAFCLCLSLCLSLCSLARKTCFRWGVPTGGPDFRGNMKDGMTGRRDDGMRLGISFCEDSTLEFTGEAGIETCYPQILPHDRDIRCPGACSPYVTYSRPLSEDLFFAACLRWILWLLWVQWPTQWLRFSTSRVHFILSVLKFIIWWNRQVHHGFTF